MRGQAVLLFWSTCASFIPLETRKREKRFRHYWTQLYGLQRDLVVTLVSDWKTSWTISHVHPFASRRARGRRCLQQRNWAIFLTADPIYLMKSLILLESGPHPPWERGFCGLDCGPSYCASSVLRLLLLDIVHVLFRLGTLILGEGSLEIQKERN